MRLATIASALVTILATALPAHALQYNLTQAESGKFLIDAKGPIVRGDADRLRDFVLSNVMKGAIVGFIFDSPGGSLLEGETIAGLVHTMGAGVFIPDNSTCASACFLILAAARLKLAGTTALIGVPSASEETGETLASMGVTTAMARDASSYGVPPSIIGRMVTTEPGRIAWLTPAELTAMGVQIVEARATEQAAPAIPQGSAPLPPTAGYVQPVPPVASISINQSPAFVQGQADRRNWEAWFGSLGPDARSGAEFWASQRSLPRPTGCQSAPTASLDWTSACIIAQQRLTPSDLRRKRDPDYKAGWNSL